ncbi:hypothetical protein ACFFMN_42575 [Planobispora siamensis]|uniref:Uncharacterized protein n=1 Tax=Planobispora siamensis TaxID=936338 RepID=A0A8J3SNJ7_9ACTN|nr:hypothetical protein [Planobispora siamensis]GIH97718.1 hypothetical protein Psi01_83480 [Planobispora siamensis]
MARLITVGACGWEEDRYDRTLAHVIDTAAHVYADLSVQHELRDGWTYTATAGFDDITRTDEEELLRSVGSHFPDGVAGFCQYPTKLTAYGLPAQTCRAGATARSPASIGALPHAPRCDRLLLPHPRRRAHDRDAPAQ